MIACISNIAWRADEEPAIARALQAAGVTAVELAPLRAVPVPWLPDRDKAMACRQFWADHGIRVVALQALLFGRDGLALFEDEPARQRMAEHLAGVLQLAAWLGATRLVFGSPGQRRKHGRPDSEVRDIGVAFFRSVGAVAQDLGACLCLEPNPPQYGCDWITTADEGAQLVRDVASPGFGLHLDAAGMLLAGDDGPAAVISHAASLRHFHVSAPQLGHVDRAAGVDYPGLLSALAATDYQGCVSIEMRAQPVASNLGAILESVGYLQQVLAASRIRADGP